MKTVETWLPVFNGFNGTIFEPDMESIESDIKFDRGENNLHDEVNSDDIVFDNDGYQKEVAIACCTYIQNSMKRLGIEMNIEFQNIHSPRDYFYGNDSINVEISMGSEMQGKLTNLIYEHREAISDYLLEKFTSYEGFISHYSNKFEVWENETKNFTELFDDNFRLGAMLEAILLDEEFDHNDMYDSIYESIGVTSSSYVTNYDELTN